MCEQHDGFTSPACHYDSKGLFSVKSAYKVHTDFIALGRDHQVRIGRRKLGARSAKPREEYREAAVWNLIIGALHLNYLLELRGRYEQAYCARSLPELLAGANKDAHHLPVRSWWTERNKPHGEQAPKCQRVNLPALGACGGTVGIILTTEAKQIAASPPKWKPHQMCC